LLYLYSKVFERNITSFLISVKKTLMVLFLAAVSTEPTNRLIATEDRVLEMVEAFYPNPVSLDTLCR
jgi:hypothetical protein